MKRQIQLRQRSVELWHWWKERNRALLPIIFAETAPLDLRIVGRMVFHAALVGVAAGLVGAAFFGTLEYVQRFLLEDLAGYNPLRAHGETFVENATHHVFRPWLLLIIPALGGLACGLITRFAPETRGGGGDAMIHAFHHGGGIVRRRVIWVKALASVFTLGTGGSGGREGPTMQIGAALGSFIGRILNVSTRERRVLLVAGVAAGMSAVFRTPLGAALLAVEVLYRDGFESDALIPSVLASVISYSVIISIYGESTLFAHTPRFPFVPAHLPFYAVLAVLTAMLATIFVAALNRSHKVFLAIPGPSWLRPALGGLALGLFSTPIIVFVGNAIHAPGQGLGLLGGGYGAVQMAISGSSWLPSGWEAVGLLLLLSGAKLVASSLTIGSGGSAGDFAPSLVVGGLFGGAFGRVLQLTLSDPRIDPGAFALVGMGVFYGGIAHVPLSALVLVCELAGNYDLLVPLMLAQGIAFVALRRRALYPSQVMTQRDSPIHRETLVLDMLRGLRVKDVVKLGVAFATFAPKTSSAEMLRLHADSISQEVFPVLGDDGRPVGLITPSSMRVLALERGDASWALAADIMQPFVSVHLDEDLRVATERFSANSLRELPVLDDTGKIIGFVGETDVAKAYLVASAQAAAPTESV